MITPAPRPIDGARMTWRDCATTTSAYAFPHWRDHLLFHEYFGASHQTGWTALVAKLLQQCGQRL